MYRSTEVRIIIIVICGGLAAWFPEQVDDWAWRSVRNLTNGRVGYVVGFIAAAMVIAECLARWCPPLRLRVERPVRWAVCIAVCAAVAYWSLRMPYWLGDYHNIDHDQLPLLSIESAEPLGTMLSTAIYRAGVKRGFLPSQIIGAETVVFGASATAALFLWTRLVAEEWPLLFAMLMSSGYIVLFWGYPEKGTPKAVALICWYVYVTTRGLRERKPWQIYTSSLILSLMSLMHGSGLCWLPAHAWYVWRGDGWRRFGLGVLVFLAPALIPFTFFYFDWAFLAGGHWGNVAAPWQWIKAYCITNCGYDFFSVIHLQDIFHGLLMLGPVATLCFPEALLRSRGTEERWLALGALGWFFLSATWFPVLGYVTDWDIFAGTPLVLSLLAITVGVRVMSADNFRRLGITWIVGSGLHTILWRHYFDFPF